MSDGALDAALAFGILVWCFVLLVIALLSKE